MVTFLFSNPGHHLQQMGPVARRIREEGGQASLVSLAELRGFVSPRGHRPAVKRAIPMKVRASPTAFAQFSGGGGSPLGPRKLMRRALWRALWPRLRWLTRNSSVVVIPNDAAWPYTRLLEDLQRRGVPWVLLQEGIRFVLPSEEKGGERYGASGAAAVCVWGEASAEHFRTVGPPERVHVTGTPRVDAFSASDWTEPGEALRRRLGFSKRPLLFLSNPIEDMGVGSTQDKLDLYRRWLEGVAPVLQEQQRPLIVKLHPREDIEAFEDASRGVDVDLTVLRSEPINAVLSCGAAAVVLASTVGLEAMMFGLPVGVLAIPGHGHLFEYVSRGAAVGLEVGVDLAGQTRLLLDTVPDEPLIEAFLHRHLANRGDAARHVADVLADVAAGGSA